MLKAVEGLATQLKSDVRRLCCSSVEGKEKGSDRNGTVYMSLEPWGIVGTGRGSLVLITPGRVAAVWAVLQLLQKQPITAELARKVPV